MNKAHIPWWARNPRTAAAALLGVMTLCVLVVKIGVDWPAFYSAAPVEVQHAAGGRPGLIGKARVYDFWRNAITVIDTQHLWHVEVSPEVLPVLVLECDSVLYWRLFVLVCANCMRSKHRNQGPNDHGGLIHGISSGLKATAVLESMQFSSKATLLILHLEVYYSSRILAIETCTEAAS